MKRPTHPLSAVPRIWPDATVVCIASGPSLTKDDVEFVRGKAKVIAINASYAMAPWADALYCADASPFKWYWDKGPRGYELVRMRDFGGLKFSLTANAHRWPGVSVLRQGPEEGLSLDPWRLCLGRNSGYQAINLAVLMGAIRIILLGYDMGISEKGQHHWFGEHPDRRRSPYKAFVKHFASLPTPLAAAGVEVINCSRTTALKMFPRRSLADVFAVVEVAA